MMRRGRRHGDEAAPACLEVGKGGLRQKQRGAHVHRESAFEIRKRQVGERRAVRDRARRADDGVDSPESLHRSRDDRRRERRIADVAANAVGFGAARPQRGEVRLAAFVVPVDEQEPRVRLPGERLCRRPADAAARAGNDGAHQPPAGISTTTFPK